MSPRSHASGLVTAVKLYPAGATTNSHSGVRDLSRVMPVLEKMAEIGMPLCIHGEVTNSESIFSTAKPFSSRPCSIRCAASCRNSGSRLSMSPPPTASTMSWTPPPTWLASITTHHLMINRNAILAGGIKPHYYCLPVAKRESHRLALRKAATSGDQSLLPGHRFRPPCRSAQGMRLRLRRHLYRDQHPVVPRPCFRGRGRARQAGRIYQPQRPGLVRTSGQQRDRDTAQAFDQPVSWPDKIETGDGPVTVFDPMVPVHWEVA
jgi:dihydroorotase